MSRALFVSDIHIASPEDPKYALLLSVLDACTRGSVTELFLVGDIFDFWIADRDYLIKTYAAVIDKLRELRRRGVKVHYFEGNHDLDLRPFWQHKLGADVHSEAAYFHLNGRRVRVEHGDQMDPDDRGYLFLRWLLRTPVLVFLGRFVPESVVRRIARRASHASRDYTTTVKAASDDQVREKIRLHAEKAHAQSPFEILVSGHVHVAEDSRAANYRYVNLGTWLKEPMLFDLSDRGAELRTVAAFLEENRDREKT